MFPRARNNRRNFLGESAESSLLGAKFSEEYIPKDRSFFPITKVTLQNMAMAYCRYHYFHDSRGAFVICFGLGSYLQIF